MPENMMNSDHKATNKNYRDNYDRIFEGEKFDALVDYCKDVLSCKDCRFYRECCDHLNKTYDLNLGE